MTNFKFLAVFIVTFISTAYGGPYTWECNSAEEFIGGHRVEGRCVKHVANASAVAQGLIACKMTCSKFGLLWPKPTGEVNLSKDLFNFLPGDLNINADTETPTAAAALVEEFKPIFVDYLYMTHPSFDHNSKKNPFPKDRSDSTVINVLLKISSNENKIKVTTDESYSLEIVPDSQPDRYKVIITAATYFGARHGLESLAQLIGYNEVTDSLQMHRSANITDKPAYPHRGFLLDTSRNFISKELIKRAIDGLSYNKLNVFHWHITDTSSFPLVLNSIPELAEWGAYSSRKVYTPKDVRELVEYARVRGVKIIPEFDAPAHVGNGWQFSETLHPEWGRLAVCVNGEEWQDFAVEPPAGQFNIVNEKVYDLLGTLYKELFDLFEPEMFHFGGDEVNLNCWNTTQEIKDHLAKEGKSGTEKDFMELWSEFQKRAYDLAVTANNDEKVKGIIWTNRMTELGAQKFISNEDYIIQIWTSAVDETIKRVINRGYQTIFSNYDAFYLDCGYSSWVHNGSYWCEYNGWKKIYENSPRKIYRNFKDHKEEFISNILGGEACLWTEGSGGDAIEGKIWPRLAALGERLWADPSSNWLEAESRMVNMRERLVSRGLGADAIQPEWCHQNENLCYFRKEN